MAVPIKNRRIAVTPAGLLAQVCPDGDFAKIAIGIDNAVKTLNETASTSSSGIFYAGGFTTLVEKGFAQTDERFIASIPEALAQTRHVCASVNAAATKAGINMDAILQVAQMLKNCPA